MIIFNILSFLILITLTNSFFNARYSKNKTLTFSILVVILLIFITYNLNYFFILILYVLSIFILYKGQCIQKLIIIIPYYIIQILLEILITYCFTLYHSTVTTLDIIEIILFVLFIALFIHSYIFIIKHIKQIYLSKYTYFIFIFPLITIYLSADINYKFIGSITFDEIIYFIALTLLNLLFFVMSLLLINYLYALQKEKIMNSNYQLLEQHYKYNFNFLHDLLHTCNVLNTQLNNDNYLEAKETLEHLTHKTFKEFNAIYSNSIILNYVINNHLHTLIENNIDIKTTVETNFDILDLQVQFELFEYLLDLSIKNCINNQTQNKYILVNAKQNQEYSLLKVVFPCSKLDEESIQNVLNHILKRSSFSLKIKSINSKYTSIFLALKK